MKQHQHPRKYKSGKITVINRGFRRWTKNTPKSFISSWRWVSGEEKSRAENESIINDIKSFEHSLPSKRNHSFIWLPGNGKVIISAPHAVKHYRKLLVIDEDGERVTSHMKGADDYTGGIAYALNKRTGMPTIILTRPGSYDPNLYDGLPYKESIRNRADGKVLLVDLHGVKLDRSFNIALGTIGGDSLLDHPGYLTSIVRHLKSEGIKSIKTNPAGFNAGGEKSQHTVTYYASHVLNLPAIQVEINERYRNPKYPNNVVRLVNALCNFINE